VTLHLVACNVHAYLLIFTCEGEFTSLSVNFSLWGNATDPWHRKAEFHRFFLMMHESSNQHGQVIGKAALLKNASFLVSLFLCRASRFETHSHLANGWEFNWPQEDVGCYLHYPNQVIVRITGPTSHWKLSGYLVFTLGRVWQPCRYCHI
jgi:hypothetical protein